jgi:hypothetical protein
VKLSSDLGPDHGPDKAVQSRENRTVCQMAQPKSAQPNRTGEFRDYDRTHSLWSHQTDAQGAKHERPCVWTI